MPDIRPVSELRNNFSDISKIVHENNTPVFLTKNGYGDMVVMSVEAYEKIISDSIINQKLIKAARESENTDVRYSFDEVAMTEWYNNNLNFVMTYTGMVKELTPFVTGVLIPAT